MLGFMLLGFGAAALAFAFLHATSFVVIEQTANRLIADLISDNAADTTLVIPHGMGSATVPKIPQDVNLDPLLPEHFTSEWHVTGCDATNITLTKTAAAGGATAAVQTRITIELPHSVDG